MERYKIYCDESCHGLNDGHPSMTLGAVLVPASRRYFHANRLRQLKEKHHLGAHCELKWTSASASKEAYYREVIEHFLDSRELRFRALVVPDKKLLRHDEHDQSHDDFYFKMYYQMVQFFLERDSEFEIYLDIKDTRSQERTRKLETVLANSQYDFDKKIVRKIQTVRSEHEEILQLADLLIGAVSAASRGSTTSTTRLRLIKQLQEGLRLSLRRTTLLSESKFNLFYWEASVSG